MSTTQQLILFALVLTLIQTFNENRKLKYKINELETVIKIMLGPCDCPKCKEERGNDNE